MSEVSTLLTFVLKYDLRKWWIKYGALDKKYYMLEDQFLSLHFQDELLESFLTHHSTQLWVESLVTQKELKNKKITFLVILELPSLVYPPYFFLLSFIGKIGLHELMIWYHVSPWDTQIWDADVIFNPLPFESISWVVPFLPDSMYKSILYRISRTIMTGLGESSHQTHPF